MAERIPLQLMTVAWALQGALMTMQAHLSNCIQPESMGEDQDIEAAERRLGGFKAPALG